MNAFKFMLIKNFGFIYFNYRISQISFLLFPQIYLSSRYLHSEYIIILNVSSHMGAFDMEYNTVAWYAAWYFNVILPRASHRRSSTPKPQIDASNYICRAAQLLSKLYATFSFHSADVPRPRRDCPPSLYRLWCTLRIMAVDEFYSTFVAVSRTESSSAINVGLLLSSF